ncbi:MAG: hypothetical protein OXP75_01075 [Rhodospirillales bacterium]|nr:hypothetical protein [Rhodospirillales bacterium]
MSRENTPADGYVIEHEQGGETYMLGFHSVTGFQAAVLPQEAAEKIAKRLGSVYGRPFNVVPAPSA